MTTKWIFCFSLLVCFSAPSSLFAQKAITWKGGAPGRETQWQCPGNWSENKVPNEFSDVVIPDISTRGLNYPVLNDVAEVHSLRLEGNAIFTIAPQGYLTVLFEIIAVDKERLKINGELKVLNGAEQNHNEDAAHATAM